MKIEVGDRVILKRKIHWSNGKGVVVGFWDANKPRINFDDYEYAPNDAHSGFDITEFELDPICETPLWKALK